MLMPAAQEPKLVNLQSSNEWATVMKKLNIVKVIGLALILNVFTLFAQSKTGTTVAQFLLIEPSARYMAMGNAAVASYEDLTSSFYNPAAIGRLSGYGMQFTHSIWIADIQYDYVSALVSMGSMGNLFFSITSLNSGEIDVRTVEQPKGTGERYSVQDIALAAGYGRKLTNRLSVGFQLSYIQETIWHSTLATAAINAGTVFELIPNSLRLGASISNFGLPARFTGRDLRIQYDLYPDRYGDNSSLPGEVFTQKFPLPVMFRVGIAMPYKVGNFNRFLFVIDAFHPNDNTESISLGGEYMFRDLVALRAGYQNLFQKDSETGLTLGGGISLDVGGFRFILDYAWADRGRLNQTQHFTLGIFF